MVELNSSCLETYKITFQSCLYLAWLQRLLILAAILDFFSKCSMVRTPHPLDVIIYMLEMNNQQTNKLSDKKGLCKKMPFGCRTIAVAVTLLVSA